MRSRYIDEVHIHFIRKMAKDIIKMRGTSNYFYKLLILWNILVRLEYNTFFFFFSGRNRSTFMLVITFEFLLHSSRMQHVRSSS